MARLTNTERDKKLAEGKALFIRGMSLQSISDIIGISVVALRAWRDEQNWEEAKKQLQISVGEMRQEILNTYNSLKKGETPKVSADDISKLSSAFEKLSDKQKNLGYMYDNYEVLTEHLAQKVISAKNKKEKELAHLIYKACRRAMDEVIEDSFNATLR
ncbi:MAG: hypothetical protein H6606_06005 [Flavobacteriales bacterium]|nr:hypothetical protein [Flavobacteriales bacterium]